MMNDTRVELPVKRESPGLLSYKKKEYQLRYSLYKRQTTGLLRCYAYKKDY